MRISFETISLLLIAIAALLVFGRWLEGVSLFPQDKEHTLTPSEFGLTPDEVWMLTGSSGEKLHGWHFDVSGKKTILYMHGNGGNISDRLPMVKGYTENGFNVLIFDYRGYGKSGGRATKRHFVRDAFTAYAYLTEVLKVEPSDIVIFGQSLGSIPALRLATSVECYRLVLEAAFLSTRQMAKDIYKYIPMWLLASNDYNNGRQIKKLDVPLLIIQGDEDGTVPFYHSSLLFDAAPDNPGGRPVSLVAIKGGGHTDLHDVDPERYFGALKAFADIE